MRKQIKKTPMGSNDNIPSPVLLESYEEISPGIVDRLALLVQKEQAHRHALEKSQSKHRALAVGVAKSFYFIAVALIFVASCILCVAVARISIIAAVLCFIFSFILLFYFIYTTKRKIISNLETAENKRR